MFVWQFLPVCTAGAFIFIKIHLYGFQEIHHDSFWTESLWTGGIFLKEENQKLRELESAREEMQALWNQMQKCGVQLYVDGKAVSPREAAVRTVRENSPYMADYVMGENGTLRQLRFDKVTRR